MPRPAGRNLTGDRLPAGWWEHRLKSSPELYMMLDCIWHQNVDYNYLRANYSEWNRNRARKNGLYVFDDNVAKLTLYGKACLAARFLDVSLLSLLMLSHVYRRKSGYINSHYEFEMIYGIRISTNRFRNAFSALSCAGLVYRESKFWRLHPEKLGRFCTVLSEISRQSTRII